MKAGGIWGWGHDYLKQLAEVWVLMTANENLEGSKEQERENIYNSKKHSNLSYP